MEQKAFRIHFGKGILTTIRVHFHSFSDSSFYFFQIQSGITPGTKDFVEGVSTSGLQGLLHLK